MWAASKLPTNEICSEINKIIAEAKLNLDEPKPESIDKEQLVKIREQMDLNAMQIEKLQKVKTEVYSKLGRK